MISFGGIGNTNAFDGMRAEEVIQNTIDNFPDIIEALQTKYNIPTNFRNTAGGGRYGEKSDGRLNFDRGHFIDMNIKSYKSNSGFNQLTRSSVANFCKYFNISERDMEELQEIVVRKACYTSQPLFYQEEQNKWGAIFEALMPDVVKWSMSRHPSREVLVFFERDTGYVRFYAMKDVLRTISPDFVFTKGGLTVGKCITFQRKGGNGSLSHNIPKLSIQHPGNDIQLKIRIHDAINILSNVLLAMYRV